MANQDFLQVPKVLIKFRRKENIQKKRKSKHCEVSIWCLMLYKKLRQKKKPAETER